MPSIVTTSEPSAWTANMVHDFTARPFARTVQAPHMLVSQPIWVPVRHATSRMKWVSRSLGSTSFSNTLPLIVIFTCIRESPWIAVLYATRSAFRAGLYTSPGSNTSIAAADPCDHACRNSDLELLCKAFPEIRPVAASKTIARRCFGAYRRFYILPDGRRQDVLHGSGQNLSW